MTVKVWIVYDSFFGNTEKVAKKLAQTLRGKHDVTTTKVTALQADDTRKVFDSELLIIGSPTRVFQPTKAIKAFIKRIDFENKHDLKVLVFDTRMDIAKVNNKLLAFWEKRQGSAVATMQKLVEKRKGSLLGPPMSFYVMDSEGPLEDQELEKGVAWVSGI